VTNIPYDARLKEARESGKRSHRIDPAATKPFRRLDRPVRARRAATVTGIGMAGTWPSPPVSTPRARRRPSAITSTSYWPLIRDCRWRNRCGAPGTVARGHRHAREGTCAHASARSCNARPASSTRAEHRRIAHRRAGILTGKTRRPRRGGGGRELRQHGRGHQHSRRRGSAARASAHGVPVSKRAARCQMTAPAHHHGASWEPTCKPDDDTLGHRGASCGSWTFRVCVDQSHRPPRSAPVFLPSNDVLERRRHSCRATDTWDARS